MSKPTFILITESPAQSWKRDASTFALAFTCFFHGWWLDMPSMTILGAFVFVYITAHSAMRLAGKGKDLTPDQARKKIEEIEREFKEGKTNDHIQSNSRRTAPIR